MTTSEISAVDFGTAQRDYWRQVRESEGFDLENVSVPDGMCGMMSGLLPYRCITFYKPNWEGYNYPYPIMVQNYAKAGLHRYNMLKGTNFQYCNLHKFNTSPNCVSSYYMTLTARDPALGAQVFQVRVDEQTINILDFTCPIARLKNEVITTKKPFVPHFHGAAMADDAFFKGELPDWPSDDALNDGKRFYLLRDSEWQANDWISLYLELVICTHDRMIESRDVFSHLEILEVAIETGVEDVEPLKAKSMNVYIKFKGIANVITNRMIFETGEHVERKAVVRRVLGERNGYMSLSGKFCGGQSTDKRKSVRRKRY